MKRGIFNRYVDYICQEMNVSKKELFSKNRTSRVSTARFLLYSICYQRPMTIIQIVDLMGENGYEIARSAVEYGIKKYENTGDVDIDWFIDTAAKACDTEDLYV